ncbi:acyl-CoA thioesterase [Burkholderia gladioli]|uniref:acyl-CoA thioesterase n=1 Tax=Burkholderia gladioli TaxID=28095 RepID=UPI003B683B15
MVGFSTGVCWTPGRSQVVGLAAHTSCEYFEEVRLPDLFTCGLRAGKIGNSSVTCEIRLFRTDGEMSVAHGVFVHVYVDNSTRRPVPLTDEMHTQLSSMGKTTV